jgi:stage III sporulation protein AH
VKNHFINFKNEKSKIKKSLAFLSVVVLVCCVGVVNNKIQNSTSMGVSAGYSEYEEAEMEAHNGEVLVDSLNITQLPGKSDDTEQSEEEESSTSGTALVASDEATGIENTDEYFREARETLTYDRNEMISMLTDTIETSADGSQKNSASAQKEKLLEYMEMEKSIESLIRNKGFTDAFVLITDKSVNVTVQTETLSERDAAKILDIVLRETDRDVDGIVIQAKAA